MEATAPLRTDELEYPLPAELIATRPADPRDSARLMVYRRGLDSVEHRVVRDLPDLLREGDQLVFNNTRVLPARIRGHRQDTGGRFEGLFIESSKDGLWKLMLRSNGRLREGHILVLDAWDGTTSQVRLTLTGREDAIWMASVEPASSAAELLESVGATPLPPYILRARAGESFDDALDRTWYQTVYAAGDESGDAKSVAAPTAGLHFTPGLLEALRGRSMGEQFVTLHVGAGTFKPIETQTIDQHPMHEERFEVSRAMLRRLQAARTAGQRVIAVGTTTVRTLESIDSATLDAAADDRFHGSTRLMIRPPYEFGWIDGLMTNFHLPRSTLLALVGALVGLDRLKALYAEAIGAQYRFYSYGDAMLILP